MNILFQPWWNYKNYLILSALRFSRGFIWKINSARFAVLRSYDQIANEIIKKIVKGHQIPLGFFLHHSFAQALRNSLYFYICNDTQNSIAWYTYKIFYVVYKIFRLIVSIDFCERLVCFICEKHNKFDRTFS